MSEMSHEHAVKSKFVPSRVVRAHLTIVINSNPDARTHTSYKSSLQVHLYSITCPKLASCTLEYLTLYYHRLDAMLKLMCTIL